VTASCLDVALSKLPDPKNTFALGIDKPLYYSVHSKWAQLTPKGGALLHAACYGEGKEEELEALIDREPDSAHDAYLRSYQQGIEAAAVLEFLLLDRLFPRSVFYALSAAERALTRLDPPSGRSALDTPSQTTEITTGPSAVSTVASATASSFRSCRRPRSLAAATSPRPISSWSRPAGAAPAAPSLTTIAFMTMAIADSPCVDSRLYQRHAYSGLASQGTIP